MKDEVETDKSDLEMLAHAIALHYAEKYYGGGV